MIISASTDYRAAAQRRLPPFLFHYIDGGAYAEFTLRHNVSDLSGVALRQRVLRDMSRLDLGVRLFNETLSMPVALGPVGLAGMLARQPENLRKPLLMAYYSGLGYAAIAKQLGRPAAEVRHSVRSCLRTLREFEPA